MNRRTSVIHQTTVSILTRGGGATVTWPYEGRQKRAGRPQGNQDRAAVVETSTAAVTHAHASSRPAHNSQEAEMQGPLIL